ncbi:hypothetical protein [Kibdelosporangium aridum]|nr:hypothetical protein [Kibdelosporangium aridum]
MPWLLKVRVLERVGRASSILELLARQPNQLTDDTAELIVIAIVS